VSVRETRAPSCAKCTALIGAFTLRFHLNARRGRAARTFAATLSRYPTLRLFVTGRRGRRRGDATRVSLARSLARSRDGRSHDSLPRGLASSSSSSPSLLPFQPHLHLHARRHLRQRTLSSPSPLAALFSPWPSRALTRGSSDRRPLAYPRAAESVLTRARTGHAHTGTRVVCGSPPSSSRPPSRPTCAERARASKKHGRELA